MVLKTNLNWIIKNKVLNFYENLNKDKYTSLTLENINIYNEDGTIEFLTENPIVIGYNGLHTKYGKINILIWPITEKEVIDFNLDFLLNNKIYKAHAPFLKEDFKVSIKEMNVLIYKEVDVHNSYYIWIKWL